MNDDEAARLLGNLAEQVPVRTAPADAILHAGHRGHRRRRGFQIVGVAAAVAVIAVGGFTVIPDSGSGTPRADGPTTTSAQLTPPPGNRLVGMNGVAVAVPEAWGTNDTKCGEPLSDTIMFQTDGARACLVTTQASALHLASLDNPYVARLVARARPAGELDGVPVSRVLVSSPSCASEPGNLCELFNALVVPSHDVILWVTANNRQVSQTVLKSAQIIPAGYTAVPDLTGVVDDSNAQQRLKDAGLAWENRCAPDFMCNMSPIEATAPPAGSVVATGSLVRAASSRQAPTDITCAGRSVAATVDTFAPPEPGVSFADVVNTWVLWHGGFEVNDVWWPTAGDRTKVFLLRPDGTAHTQLNLTQASNGGWYLNTYAACPPNARPTLKLPIHGAEHIAVSESGAIAAWFDESQILPQLVVYDTDSRRELAREDLGVGDVATDPGLTVTDDAVFYQTAIDPNVQMRYRWSIDDYPTVYDVQNGSEEPPAPASDVVPNSLDLLGSWRAVTLLGQPVDALAQEARQLTFTRNEGRLVWTALADCNSASGRLRLTSVGDFSPLPNIEMTTANCGSDDPTVSVPDAVMQTSQIRLVNGQLVLYAEDGSDVGTFTR